MTGVDGVVVATWNVFLGTDLDTVVAAADEHELARAAAEVLDHSRRTQSLERAEVIAKVIADARPDIVAVQELGVWDRLRPAGPEVVSDHRAILDQALETTGSAYAILFCNDTYSTVLPMPEGDPVRFTSCDAVLLRVDSTETVVVDADAGTFGARSSRDLAGGEHQVTMTGGWIEADLQIGGSRIRVLAAHLDRERPDVRARQVDELVTVASRSPYPVVLMGDLNAGEFTGDGSDEVLARLSAAGFVDAWPRRGDGPGFTTGRGRELGMGDDLTRRIDFVLYDPDGLQIEEVRLLGADAATDTSAGQGRWVSDHAGVVARLTTAVGER